MACADYETACRIDEWWSSERTFDTWKTCVARDSSFLQQSIWDGIIWSQQATQPSRADFYDVALDATATDGTYILYEIPTQARTYQRCLRQFQNLIPNPNLWTNTIADVPQVVLAEHPDLYTAILRARPQCIDRVPGSALTLDMLRICVEQFPPLIEHMYRIPHWVGTKATALKAEEAEALVDFALARAQVLSKEGAPKEACNVLQHVSRGLYTEARWEQQVQMCVYTTMLGDVPAPMLDAHPEWVSIALAANPLCVAFAPATLVTEAAARAMLDLLDSKDGHDDAEDACHALANRLPPALAAQPATWRVLAANGVPIRKCAVCDQSVYLAAVNYSVHAVDDIPVHAWTFALYRTVVRAMKEQDLCRDAEESVIDLLTSRQVIDALEASIVCKCTATSGQASA